MGTRPLFYVLLEYFNIMIGVLKPPTKALYNAM